VSEQEAEDGKSAKKQSVMTLVMGLVLVTILAVGAGWFVATNLLQPQDVGRPGAKETQSKSKSEVKKAGKKDHEEGAESEPDGKAVTALHPIVVGLGRGQKTWLRIEMAVIAARSANLEEPQIKSRIASDIAAFLRNLTLDQISGPSGYLHLKEDLLDRARLSTEGKVDEVIITTLVVE